MALSSINFQKVSVHSFKHNDRTEAKTAATVFTEKTDLNICDVAATDAKRNLNLFFKESISKVTGKTRRAKKENTLVEAVVNIKPNTTMEDLKKLQAHIEKEFGFKGLQIAIHRDEGHYEDGKFITNEHAHMSFFTLDRETGRQMFRREHITRDKLSKLQDKTAELLVMDRGQKVEVTGRKRLNHKDYKQSKKQELAKVKDLNAEIKQLRAELKENKATREDYAELEQLNRDLKAKIKAKDLTLDELKAEIEGITKQKEHYKSVVTLKDIEITEQQVTINDLEIQKRVLEVKVVDLEEKRFSLPNMSDYKTILEENKKLKEYETHFKNNNKKILQLQKDLEMPKDRGFIGWIKEKFNEFKEEILGLKAENTSLTKQINSLRLENDRLVEEIENLKNDLKNAEFFAEQEVSRNSYIDELDGDLFQNDVDEATKELRKEINKNRLDLDRN